MFNKIFFKILKISVFIMYSLLTYCFLASIQVSRNLVILNSSSPLGFDETTFFRYYPVKEYSLSIEQIATLDGILLGFLLAIPLILLGTGLLFPDSKLGVFEKNDKENELSLFGGLLLVLSLPAIFKFIWNILMPIFNTNKAPLLFHFSYFISCIESNNQLSLSCIDSYKYMARLGFIWLIPTLILLLFFMDNIGIEYSTKKS